MTNTANQPKLLAILDLIKRLRSENGCPWDKKQTPETMINYLLNETYELQDAIHSGNSGEIKDEIGDVLFQLMFIVFLYLEKNAFSINDIIDHSITKMKKRHPHVFGDVSAETVEEVMENWEAIKASEKNDRFSSIIDSVPSGMPSLSRAYLISEKVGKAGFDWDDMDGVIEKVTEEWAEWNEALNEKNKDNISLEFGDLLFTLTNIARFAGIHPETALSQSVTKFEKRYRYMEKILFENGKELLSISRQEIDSLWEKAKKNTK